MFCESSEYREFERFGVRESGKRKRIDIGTLRF